MFVGVERPRVRSNAVSAASPGHAFLYFSCSKSSVRLFLPVEDASEAPCEFCTWTWDMLAPASLTWMRYCGCALLGAARQNMSLSARVSFWPALRSTSGSI